ncbi:MAG: hypothetical protein BWY31_01161 [Lentisphaerae bacterium ADurb.Bin242]|nr:MAG: hypothetical protein BWY31_01161 [Lentisphaerae bacterium ADurb.Bin242]
MNSIECGWDRRTINPVNPVSLGGYFNVRMWESIADDLEVRTLVFRQGETLALIVQFDLLTVTERLYLALVEELAALGVRGIDWRNLICTATHTHTAPLLKVNVPGADPEFTRFAARQGALAVLGAIAALHPGQLYCGMTMESRFLFNRRYWMNDGTVVTNPGKLNPAIRRPEGEIDPEIPLLAFGCDGKIEAVIGNIVNHTDTIGGSQVSADWAGFAVRAVQEGLAPGGIFMPLIGCSGNINHFDISTAANQTCYDEARRIGCGYAETIIKTLSKLQALPLAELRIYSQKVTVAKRRLTAVERAEAEAMVARYPEINIVGVAGSDLTSEDLAKETPFALKYFAYHALQADQHTEPLTFRLTGIDFGAAIIATLPGEPFVEIGLRLRKEILHGKLAMVVSHCNGTGHPDCFGGYIPNKWNYGRGGYETTLRSNPFSEDTAGILLASWWSIANKEIYQQGPFYG